MQEQTDVNIFSRVFKYDVGDKVVLHVNDTDYDEQIKSLDGHVFVIRNTNLLRKSNGEIEPFYVIDRYGYLFGVNEKCIDAYIPQDGVSDDPLVEEYWRCTTIDECEKFLRATKFDEEIIACDIYDLIGWI